MEELRPGSDRPLPVSFFEFAPTEMKCDAKGFLHVPVRVVLWARGEKIDSVRVVLFRFLHLEDLTDASSARTRAFLAAWYHAWRVMYAMSYEPLADARHPKLRPCSSTAVRRPELQTRDDFDRAVAREVEEAYAE
ncbi:MAG: hypothetical protein AAGE52_42805 [Myxococcota bacterium]